MQIFKRNKNSDVETLPPEVQEYYRSESRAGKGIALLIGLASLVVTVLLALGIFYGGRWAYRQIFDNNDTPAVVTEENEANQNDGSDQTINTGTPESDTNADGSSDDGAANAPATGTSSTSTTTPRTGSDTGTAGASTGNLPRTGPDVDL